MTGMQHRGVTLIELMVVLAVLGVILAVAAPSFADLVNKRRVAAAASELSTNLAYARSESALRNETIVVKFNASRSMTCYTVAVWGGLGNCDCTNGPGTACRRLFRELKTSQLLVPAGVTLTPDDGIRASLNAVTFDPPHSRPTPGGVGIRIVGNRGYQLEVQINAIGRVLTCSPDGTFGGVARC